MGTLADIKIAVHLALGVCSFSAAAIVIAIVATIRALGGGS